MLDDGSQTIEGAATDEKDVGGIDLDEFLMGMLAAALRGNGSDGTLQDLQQSLLHAFTAYIAGDGGVLALAGNLVDLVDVDDAALSQLDIIIGVLD